MVDFRIDVIVDPSRVPQGTRVVERQLVRVENAADRLRQTLARAFAFIAVGAAVRQIIRMADTLTNLQNRLRLVTNGTEELNQVTEELFGIANRTRSAFEATGELYARLALSSKELGRSQQELLNFTESLNQAVILSGAAAQEARNGIIQLSQGIASGALRGDELRSVLEQLPAVADVIAKQLGITRGELRILGEQGKITADVILDAFKASREELADRFAQTVPTVGQAFEVLQNRIIEFIGAFDQATGFTSRLAEALLSVAANIEQFIRAVAAAATFLITVFVQRAIVGTIRALASLSVALLTNPLFALGALIAASVAAIVAFGDQILATSDGITTLRDVVVAAFNAINQTIGPILTSLGNTLAEVFGGQFFTLRQLAEAFALTFDQIVGAVRGSVLLVNDLLTSQLGGVLRGTIAFVTSFGLRLRQVFEEIANGLVGLFIDPVGTILRAIQTLLSSVLGAAAVAAQLGAISEDSRIAVEDAASGIEAALNRLNAQRDPVTIFDTDETRRQIQELNTEAESQFSQVGQTLKNSFLEGFEADTTLGFVRSIFDEAEQIAREREAEQARQAAARRNQTSAGLARVDPRDPDQQPQSQEIARQVQNLLRRVEVQQQVNDQIAELDRLFRTGKVGVDSYAEAVAQLELRALEASTSLEDGFARAFAKIAQEAENLAAVGESIVNAFADRATDALVTFAETGQFSFKEFARAILKDLTRIIARLLIVQALNAAFGGGVGTTAGAAASAGAAGARQEGGTVQPARSFVVGENGPELFVPDRTGTIVPNPADSPAAPPQVNVQVVNVENPEAVPQAIASGSATEAILNMVGENKERFQQVLQ